MRSSKEMFRLVVLMAVLLAISACGNGKGVKPASDVITGTEPIEGAIGIDFTTVIKVTFSQDIDETTLTSTNVNLTRANGVVEVPGAISYDVATKTLTFTPDFPLIAEALYTFTISSAVITKATDTSNGGYMLNFTTDVRPVLYRSNVDPNDPTSSTATASWNIWSMNADGTGKVALTNHAAGIDSSWGFFANAWSPGYEHIAYQTYDTPNEVRDLWIMDADGSDQLNVTNGATAGARIEQVQWAPDGTKVYYTYRTAYGEPHNMYAAQLDGTMTQLTSYTGSEVTEMMRISPDGSRMLYRLRDRATDRNELYVMELDSLNYDTHALTSFGADTSIFQNEYSPDGTQAFFEAGETGTGANTNLFVGTLDATGTEFSSAPSALTSLGAGQSVFSFSISPDGSKVAYTVADSTTGETDLFIMNADGSSAQQISNTSDQFSRELLWSPDGTMLAFGIGSLSPGNAFNLVITDPSSFTLQHNITNFGGQMQYVEGLWSTDSTRFIYHYHDSINGINFIFISDADGSNNTDIASGGPGQSFILLDWWPPVFSVIP